MQYGEQHKDKYNAHKYAVNNVLIRAIYTRENKSRLIIKTRLI